MGTAEVDIVPRSELLELTLSKRSKMIGIFTGAVALGLFGAGVTGHGLGGEIDSSTLINWSFLTGILGGLGAAYNHLNEGTQNRNLLLRQVRQDAIVKSVNCQPDEAVRRDYWVTDVLTTDPDTVDMIHAEVNMQRVDTDHGFAQVTSRDVLHLTAVKDNVD